MVPGQFLGILGLLVYTALPAQRSGEAKTVCEKASMLAVFMEKMHVTGQPAGMETSVRTYDLMFERIDPLGLIFLEKDMKAFSEYRSKLHTSWGTYSCLFLNNVTAVYTRRLKSCDSITQHLLAKPLDFKTVDVFTLDLKNKSYAPDLKGLAARWNKWLRLEALYYMFDSDVETGKIPTPSSALKKEPEAREKLKKMEGRRIKRKTDHTGGIEAYLAELFLDAMARSFDPHSTYFTMQEKQEFQNELSTDILTFGFELDENDKENIEIVHLVPGGAAWKTNVMHEGDRVLKITWDDGSVSVMADSELYDVDRKLASVETKKIKVTLLSADGTTETVSLSKEKAVAEDNIVNSFILHGERKVGYIALPGFYTEWETINPLGCANDVAKEIIKLKEESIGGLILDLRDNGGGSLSEAIQLAGIFINEGPILVTTSRGEKPVVYKDVNRGTIYNGPMLVLVNHNSASASELLAATLQDYKRAIIAGTSTYGKATGQVILPLDTSLHNISQDKWSYEPQDYSKVTVEKLYRVTSITHQKQGVIPDIEIPDIAIFADGGERDNPYCLTKDSITKKVYYTALDELPLAYLKEKSNSRIKSDTLYSNLKQWGDSISGVDNITNYPLQADRFYSFLQREEKIWDKMDQYSERPTSRFKTENHKYDIALFNQDVYHKEINQRYMEYISVDPAIEESFNVLIDLILKTE
ncbi:MAG: carboxy terminal-processing peptidase [Flavobacteriales bacterium]